MTSKKISRLDKEAILRAKESQYKREQAAGLLSGLKDEETEEEERHRRFALMRQTRQIQREVDYQQKITDKIQERIQQDFQKRQTQTTKTTARSYTSPTPSSAILDRPNRTVESYTKGKHESGGKPH